MTVVPDAAQLRVLGRLVHHAGICMAESGLKLCQHVLRVGFVSVQRVQGKVLNRGNRQSARPIASSLTAHAVRHNEKMRASVASLRCGFGQAGLARAASFWRARRSETGLRHKLARAPRRSRQTRPRAMDHVDPVGR